MTVLIGYGGHGQDIEALYGRNHNDPLFVYDEAVDDLPRIDDVVYYGINDPIQRRAMADRLQCMPASPLVDHTASIGHDCHISGGCIIAPHAILLTAVHLGLHVHVNYSATMTRCVVGSYSTISPAATICGDVEIGEECLIGANATVCDRVRIGNRCRIGAGAIIPPASVVPDGTTVIGVYHQ